MKSPILLLFSIFSFNVILAQGIPARVEANLDDVYSLYNLTGDGVLLVMIDRGVDYRHPDFLDENGHTRLAYIYDMLDPSGAGDPDNPYGIGTIFTESEINSALDNNDPPLSTDRFGHGTATTGIAAGNGSGTVDGAFQGVAPKAKIISVKITQDAFPPFGSEPGQSGFFDPSYIPVALEFVTDKINELGMPAVTLMNIGSIGGPTDGTSLIARSIDDFVSNGNTFVCGVGDDGGADNHASGTIGQSQTIELEVVKGETGNLRFDLWYSENDRFTVSIQRPNGTIHGPFTAPSGPGGIQDQNLGDIFMYHRGADTEFFQATSNRRELLIDFAGVTGTYKVILEGAQINSGNFHAVLNPSTHGNTNRFNTFVVPGYSINDYASSNLVITPGDYVVKNDWFDINGIFRDITGQGETGEIWIGSSSSPTQDERLGIDFTASGEVCHAAYADNTYYEFFEFNVLQGSNGLYGIQNAVSAAAPLSTGVIALMLEAKPSLTPNQIRTILRNTAREDSFTGATPNDTWGYGKLDALAAIEASLSISEETISKARLFPNPVKDRVFLQFNQPQSNVKVTITTVGGQTIQTFEWNATSKVEIPLNTAPGLYFLVVTTEESTEAYKILKT